MLKLQEIKNNLQKYPIPTILTIYSVL